MKEKLIKIPYQRLSPDALQGLIEEFITREGTEYGHKEFSLAQKVAQVRSQLKTGQAVITYDEISRTCNIIPKEKTGKRDSAEP